MLELNFSPFPVLETQRLLLRRFTLDDVDDMLILRTDDVAMKYIQKPKQTRNDILKMLAAIEDGLNNNTAIGWGICLKNNNRIIGSIGYHNIYKDCYRAEIGYMILPEFWRQGYTNEAIKATVNYAFQQMKLHSIEAKIHPDNIASAAILKKNDFVKEAYFKENYFLEGKFYDTEVYSLLGN